MIRNSKQSFYNKAYQWTSERDWLQLYDLQIMKF